MGIRWPCAYAQLLVPSVASSLQLQGSIPGHYSQVPKDSCFPLSSPGHSPLSEMAPVRTRSLVGGSVISFWAMSIKALSPGTSAAFRSVVQSISCLRAAAPAPLEPSWREGTLLSSVSKYLSPFQPPTGHFLSGDWLEPYKYSFINTRWFESPARSSGSFFERQREAIKLPDYETLNKPEQTITAPWNTEGAKAKFS